MKRRAFIKKTVLASGGLVLSAQSSYAKTYLTLEQAMKVLWGTTNLKPLVVNLTEEQEEEIEDASDIRVRHLKIKTWRTSDGGWFILDQVIGKHENIDMAYAYTKDGKVKGLEVLTYRETYGHQVRNDRWRQQFHGKNYTEFLKLDKQIKNISGATLSCRHITDGINRMNHTWNIVLKHL